MFSNLAAKIKTTKEKRDLINSLNRLEASLFNLKDDFNKVLSEEIPEKYSDTIRSELGQGDRQKTIKELKLFLENFRSLKLAIAFSPSQSIVSEISSWAKTNIGEDVLVDLTYDESVIGGAQITFEGEFKDYSIRKKFEEAKEETFIHILQMLKSAN